MVVIKKFWFSNEEEAERFEEEINEFREKGGKEAFILKSEIEEEVNPEEVL